MMFLKPWANPTSQHKRHIDRPFCSAFLQGSNTTVTDRQTDHATRFVTTGRVYVNTTVMRPNNNTRWAKGDGD